MNLSFPLQHPILSDILLFKCTPTEYYEVSSHRQLIYHNLHINSSRTEDCNDSCSKVSWDLLKNVLVAQKVLDWTLHMLIYMYIFIILMLFFVGIRVWEGVQGFLRSTVNGMRMCLPPSALELVSYKSTIDVLMPPDNCFSIHML